jgi:hypothetical protein
MDTFVIRLWQRVGTLRAAFALVILAGLTGGLVIANRQTQHDPSGSVKAGAAFPLGSPSATSSATPTVSQAPTSSAQRDALAKAQQAATEAAAQAKTAEDEARRKAEEQASRSKSRPPSPTATATAAKYPVPSSCQTYSGNRQEGCAVLVAMGFGLDQMPCLD